MKKLLLSIILVLGFSFCEGQSWVWVKQGETSNKNSGSDPQSLAIDTLGNIYETGIFWGGVSFGTFNLNVSINEEYFIVKYDSSGNVLWANDVTTINSAYSSQGNSVTTDMRGNIYATGYFGGKIAFDLDTLNAGSVYSNLFLTKYNQNGNVIWTRSGSLSSRACYAIGYSVKADTKNNIYVVGYFHDTISFGSFMLTSDAIQGDNFLVKYDSSGNVLWAKSGIVNKIYECAGESVTTDDSDNVYTTGVFFDSVSFGPYLLKSNQEVNGFIVKYNSNGNVIWAKEAIGSNNSSFGFGSAVIADDYGNIYLTGVFNDSIIFDSYFLTTKQVHGDVFLVKYNKYGDVVWAESAITPSSSTPVLVEGYSLTLDKWNHLYVSGTYNDTITFGGLRLISDSLAPSFLMEFDTSGNALCGTFINNYNDDANLIVSDSKGNIYFGGDLDYYKDCSFGYDTIKGFGGAGNEVAFLAEWQSCLNNTEGINKLTNNSTKISLFPNPNTGVFTIEVNSEERIVNSVEVYNVMGQKVFSMDDGQLSIINSLLSINLGYQPNGVYLYRVIDETGKLLGEGKFVIEK